MRLALQHTALNPYIEGCAEGCAPAQRSATKPEYDKLVSTSNDPKTSQNFGHVRRHNYCLRKDAIQLTLSTIGGAEKQKQKKISPVRALTVDF